MIRGSSLGSAVLGFVTRTSMLLMVALMSVLQGCALMPGMVAIYSKPAEVRESAEEPVSIDYTLLKVTPMLVRQLNEQMESAVSAQRVAHTLPVAKSYPYLLGRQDVLRIFVWGNPDLSPVTTSVTASNIASTPAGRTIDNEGNIYFPFVGDIRAEGLTIPQFRVKLSSRLSKYIRDPQVEVDVAAFRSQRVFVSGQVRNPGVISITDQPLRITDAIAQSGGANDNSDLYSVVLTRGNVSVSLNLDRLYYNGDISENILLQHGDIVSVPDRMMRKVYVLGEVGNAAGINQARSYVMRRGRMTLTEVLADAGGANPFSSAANQVYLMRADSNGRPIVYLLDASEPQSLVMANEFPVQPRDLIFVNPTAPTLIGRIIGQFLPILSVANTASTTPF